MEQHRTIYCGGQVIEEYSRTYPAEVVETYTRPLPGVGNGQTEEIVQSAPQKRSRKGLFIFLACLGALIAGAAILTWYYGLPHDSGDNYYHGFDRDEPLEEVFIPRYTEVGDVSMTLTAKRGEELSAQEVYRRVNPAVVTVLGQIKGSDMMSVGTGVIFREDGYILTNQHVVAGCDQCVILLENDTTFEALFVAGDADNDIAILKMDVVGLPEAEFGNSDDLEVGDPVYAIGSPLRVEVRGTLTNGIVSAINRDVDMGDKTMTLIQTNAALNNGNSGGPLINSCGQVVGINVIKMYSQDSTVEGLGFAIPSSYMERIVNDLLTYGETQPEPLIGISAMQVAEQLGEAVWGLEIVDVAKGSAADKAGVKVGDYLLEIDGNETLTSQTVLRVRRKHYVGDKLTLTIWRSGTVFKTTLQLEESVS